MKKIITVVLAISMMFALVACSSDKETLTPSEMMTKIRQEIEFPEMAEIDKENIIGFYEIDIEKISNMSYIMAGGGATADEVLILEMVDDTDMSDITTKMQTRLTMQKDLLSRYNPDENAKLESAVVKTKGKYAFFAITNNNSKAEKIFNESV